MDAMEALKGRRSVRVYEDRAVGREIIREIIDAGRLAPTANNVQPWEFVVVTDPGARRQIADLTDYGKFIAQAPVCIAVFCKNVKRYVEDGCAATENLLVAAHALGLGTCWVAGTMKSYGRPVADLLGVPDGYELVSLVSLGYPGTRPGPHGKRKLDDVLHWERF